MMLNYLLNKCYLISYFIILCKYNEHLNCDSKQYFLRPLCVQSEHTHRNPGIQHYLITNLHYIQKFSTVSKMPGETYQPCFFPKSTQREIMSGSDETQSKLFHTCSYLSLIAVRMGWKKEVFKLSGHMEMSPSIPVLPLDVSVCINADNFFIWL